MAASAAAYAVGRLMIGRRESALHGRDVRECAAVAWYCRAGKLTEGSMRRGMRADLKWALAVLMGVALGALLFGSFDGFLGALIGATAVVIVSAVVRRRRERA
jgi:hypothetical protein